MIRLALLRHGHTAWNRAGRVQGRSDIPLDAEAVDALSNLRLPAPWDQAALWSSPLERAVHTAALVADRPPRTDPALIEMNWGDWEGRIARDLRADPACDHRDIEDWGWDYTPPKGESPAALRAPCHLGHRPYQRHGCGLPYRRHAGADGPCLLLELFWSRPVCRKTQSSVYHRD